jgi:hypothetical protein
LFASQETGKFIFNKEKSQMTATLTTATVVRFVLIIDPNNEKGKKETFEFTDAADLSAKRTEFQKEEIAYYKAHPNENYDPMEHHFFTEYRRDDDGTIFQQDSYSVPMKGRPSRKAGDKSRLVTCKCGKTDWLDFPPKDEIRDYPVTGEYVCEDCNRGDDDISRHDFTNYDGMQEPEY